MTDPIFASMRAQMVPSEAAQAALWERLSQTKPQKERRPMLKYIAAAACTALLLTAYPVHKTLQPQPPKPLHSYVTVEGSANLTEEREKITDRGEEISTGGTEAPTGVIDLPATPQELEWALTAYQTLTARFEEDYGPGAYPDWYGGAYLDEYKGLVVNVLPQEGDDKALLLSIQEMAGSDRITFGEAKYALRDLNDLQKRVVEKMVELKVLAGCGVDEKNNRLDLTLTEKTDEALAFLAEVDPGDDAIYVQIGERAVIDVLPGGAIVGDDSEIAPAVRQDMEKGQPVPDEGEKNVIATEPQVEDLPQEKQPGLVSQEP